MTDLPENDASRALINLGITILEQAKSEKTTGLSASSVGQCAGVLDYLLSTLYGFEPNHEMTAAMKMQGMQMASLLAGNFLPQVPGTYWVSLTEEEPLLSSPDESNEITERLKISMADIAGTGSLVNVNPIEWEIMPSNDLIINFMVIWDESSGGSLLDVAKIDPGVKVVDRHVMYLAAGALTMQEKEKPNED